MAFLSLIAKLGLDKTGFDAGMTAAGKRISSLGSSLKSQLAGAFTTAAVIAATKSILDYGDSIRDAQELLQTNAQAAQEWSLAARLNGKDVEFVSANMLKLSEAMSKAVKGNQEIQQAFSALGVSFDDLHSKSVSEVATQIADSISKIGINAETSAAAIDLFGVKSAGKMLLILQDLEQAKKIEFVDEESLAQLKTAKDELEILKTKSLSLGAKIGGALGTGFKFLRLRLSGKSSEDAAGEAFGLIKSTPPQVENRLQDIADQVARDEHIAQMDRLLALTKQIDELTLKRLPVQQQINQLLEKRRGIMDDIVTLTGSGSEFELRQAQLDLSLLKIDDTIKTLQGQIKPQAPEPALPVGGGNQLSRIGAFTGGGRNQFDQGVNKLDRKLNEIKRVLDLTGIRVKEFN